MATIQELLATAGKIPAAKFGGVTDHTEFESDGSPFQRGGATLWEDLTGSLISRRLDSVLGALQYDYDENSIIMNSGGVITNSADRLIFNFQKPHGARVDSTFNLHIHWEQSSANQIEFTLQYRIQENNAIKNVTWTTVASNSVADSAFTYPGAGTFNQITSLADVDWSGVSISSTIQFRLARTDATAGDIHAVFVDGHVERDNNGSRQEYVK